MKTTITERERQILTCAANILISLENNAWHEYVTDTKSNGQCKYHGKAHKCYNKARRSNEDIAWLLMHIE